MKGWFSTILFRTPWFSCINCTSLLIYSYLMFCLAGHRCSWRNIFPLLLQALPLIRLACQKWLVYNHFSKYNLWLLVTVFWWWDNICRWNSQPMSSVELWIWSIIYVICRLLHMLIMVRMLVDNNCSSPVNCCKILAMLIIMRIKWNNVLLSIWVQFYLVVYQQEYKFSQPIEKREI